MEASFLPFSIPVEEVARLNASEGFQSIRRSFASQQGCPYGIRLSLAQVANLTIVDSSCQDHNLVSLEDGDAWVLHRDIIHALILPVLQIHGRASRLADLLLRPSIAVDLELAFRGEARGAFSWLQCLVSDEVDLCCTKSCPACIVTHVLHSEPTIRLVLVAFRIPEYANVPDSSRPNLPSFAFWLRSLRTALDTNPFWGSGYWAEVDARAMSLENGIQELLQQCRVLDDFIASANHGVRMERLSDNSGRVTLLNRSKTTDVCHFPLARQQRVPVAEEQAWMRSIILSCWKTLLAEAACERRNQSLTRGSVPDVRPRSSTA